MNLTLELLADNFAICRLEPSVPIPDWTHGDFVSITRTGDELSIVCRQDRVPGDVKAEYSWRCLRIAGNLDFSLVGVIASLTSVLAGAGISVFVISTFDRDFLLVKESDLKKAVAVLEEAGHRTGGHE
jgi:hypothetical protein